MIGVYVRQNISIRSFYTQKHLNCQYKCEGIQNSLIFNKLPKGEKMKSAIFIVLFAISNIYALKPCPGDTRGDKRCNHDPTHRVCAKVST